MSNDLSVGLLTVLGVLAGMASLLFLLSVLEPSGGRTASRLGPPSHKATLRNR